MESEIKQVIIIRTDLGMSTGKKCAQACHAAISASNLVRTKQQKIWKDWLNAGQKKVVLKIRSEDELKRLHFQCEKASISSYMIRDAGLTQLEPGTTTALGIGPVESSKVDKITGDLKLL